MMLMDPEEFATKLAKEVGEQPPEKRDEAVKAAMERMSKAMEKDRQRRQWLKTGLYFSGVVFGCALLPEHSHSAVGVVVYLLQTLAAAALAFAFAEAVFWLYELRLKIDALGRLGVENNEMGQKLSKALLALGKATEKGFIAAGVLQPSEQKEPAEEPVKGKTLH